MRLSKTQKERQRQKRKTEELRRAAADTLESGSGIKRTVSERSPAVNEEAQDKKRKLVEAVKQNKASFVITRPDGMDLTIDEVDRVGQYLDAVLPCRGRKGEEPVQLEFFSYSWGRLTVGLRRKDMAKGLRDELKEMERLELKVWKEDEAPEPLLYVGFVYNKRGTGKDWVARLAETYSSSGLTLQDFRLRGEAKKPNGSTVILQLSERAVELLNQDDMVAYVGVSRVELRKWEEKPREDDDEIMELEEVIEES